MCDCNKIGKSKKRRSKVGAMGNMGSLIQIGAAIGGGILAKLSNRVLDNVSFLSDNPAIKSAVKLSAGVAIVGYSTDPNVQALGTGMAVVGGSEIVGGIIPALGSYTGPALFQLGSPASAGPMLTDVIMNNMNMPGAQHAAAGIKVG